MTVSDEFLMLLACGSARWAQQPHVPLVCLLPLLPSCTHIVHTHTHTHTHIHSTELQEFLLDDLTANVGVVGCGTKMVSKSDVADSLH